MTKEEAIGRIKDHMERHRIGEYPHIKIGEALEMAITALREQEPVTNRNGLNCIESEAIKVVDSDQFKPGWISVEDRLPEDDPNIKKHVEGEKFGLLTVLVYNGVVKQTNRFFCNVPQLGLPQTDGWEWASMNVTHWMPLPAAPEEKENPHETKKND